MINHKTFLGNLSILFYQNDYSTVHGVFIKLDKNFIVVIYIKITTVTRGGGGRLVYQTWSAVKGLLYVPRITT